jgi:hypothetical protein
MGTVKGVCCVPDFNYQTGLTQSWWGAGDETPPTRTELELQWQTQLQFISKLLLPFVLVFG